MTDRLISIIIGMVLVAVTGTSVYLKKQPVSIPNEESVQTIDSVVSNTNSNSNIKNKLSTEHEDEDEREDNVTTNQKTTTTTQPSPTATTATGGISLAQIAKHSSRTSCWSAINSNVYDLTSWIPNHPGGEQAILYLCGIDGSSDYNGQHGGSSKTAKILTGFKIGVLAK